MSTCEDSAFFTASLEEDADQTLVSADGISAGTSGAWDSGDSAAPDLSSKSDMINGNKSDAGDSNNKSDIINGNKSDAGDSINKSDIINGNKSDAGDSINKSDIINGNKCDAGDSINKSNIINGNKSDAGDSNNKSDIINGNKSDAGDSNNKSDIINGNKSDAGDSNNKSDIINGNKSDAGDSNNKSDIINGNKSDAGDSNNKSDIINGNKSDAGDSNNKSDTNNSKNKSNLSSSSKSGKSSSNKSNTSNGSNKSNLGSSSKPEVNHSKKADVNGVSRSGSSSLARKKDAASVSNERVKKKPPLRVVQSRFKAAAAAAKNNSGNSSSGSRNGSNNSSSLGSPSSRNGCLNTTLVGGSSTFVAGNKGPTKGRPVRASMAPAASGPISRSTVNIAKTGVLPSRATNKSSPRTQVSQSATNIASHGPTGMTRPSKPMAVRANRHKLHSTVLNATVLGDKTHKEDSSNVFSTTLVGGMAPGGRNLDLTCVTLPELPDISAIRLDSVSNENRSGDTTVLSSVSEKDSTQDSNDCSMHEVTAEELELEYLRYMQWTQVNLSSKSVFQDQIKDAETQIMFLEQLISEKQKELSERRQMTEIVVHHQHVAEARQNQTELLQRLIDALPASEEAMQTMSRELEKSLHQVKMDNLYVPENHKQYRDQLSDALTDQVSLLKDLESLLDTRSNHLQSTISLLGELQNTTHRIQQCENEVHKAARLSVQEASLQIGATQTQGNGTSSHDDDSFNLVISA
ncbi:dentin sialophosphoprotein-like [Penaeus chinensis]|uniref:dentin sialophosphoprotein-like n=1 Tax=Penaeus chinensis TaxID=139456 RepID=UPI001FB8192B|nr:dentin sialophosphoprotein-like [Penaeus chinensis]